MHEVAAPDNEHTFIAQRREPFPDFVVKGIRLRLINAELHYWNVCLRENVTEHRPGSVIQSPLLVKSYGDGREKSLNAAGKLRVSGRGILDFVQLSREAAEVMDSPRGGCSSH
jgi:hypothetical protein